jgi:hypothetical protein
VWKGAVYRLQQGVLEHIVRELRFTSETVRNELSGDAE